MGYIAIVDYGAGNLMSVHNTLDFLGYENKVASTGEVIENAAGVILPGVGAFPDAMAALHDSGLTDAVVSAAQTKPFLGICLGMQMAVVEFARHVCGMTDAHSSELSATTQNPVIDLMPEQRDITEKGGTMRLGAYPCRLSQEDSNVYRAYQDEVIYERHRHRYEFNNAYRDTLTKCGLRLTGLSPNERLVEIVEIADHPWFVGVQFHPEFKSRPNKAHPLFRDFIKAAKEQRGK